MPEYRTINALPSQEERIDALKVHKNQADHEILEVLLDTYDRYARIMGNDMDDGR